MIGAPAKTINTDLAWLREKREAMLADKKARVLGPEGAEALAECNFRIALNPETEVIEALQLLRESVRLDGANPKYAYHLARIHFAHGDLDTAATWLQTAVTLCPTSHRLWAHVGLLQRELNAKYFGNELYEPDALRGWAEQVEENIAGGADAFEPTLLAFTPPISKAELEKQSRQGRNANAEAVAAAVNGAARGPAFRPVKRLTRSKACRWTGIHDLRVEYLLQAKPTKRGLGRLIPLLTQAAEAASKRKGGPAGFCILGVLWLVAGYPVGTIRRLAPVGCPGGPSRELLDAVCDLFESPVHEVPGRLAAALKARTLPPLLAAIIHRRRVLNRPLEFRAMTTLRAARRLISDARLGTATETAEKDATDVARRLVSAVEVLFPPPPDELKDEPPATKKAGRDPATLVASFAALQRAAVVLEEAREKGFAFLKGDLTPRASSPDETTVPLALADRDALGAFVAALKAAGELGDSQVEAIVQELSKHPESAPPDFQNAREECQKKFRGVQALGNFEKVFVRLDRSLTAARATTPPAGAPSPALAALLAEVRGAVPSDAASSGGEGDVSDDPAAAVLALQKRAAAMTAALDTDWGRIQSLAAAHKKNEPPLSEADRSEAIAIRGRVEETMARSKVLLEEVAALRSGGQVPLESIPALDATEKEFQAIGTRNGPFTKKFVALQLPDAPAAKPAKPAPPPVPGSANGRPAANVPLVPLADRPNPPPADRAGVAGLTAVYSYAEREIARAFSTAEATFDPYSAADLATPGLSSLRWTVLARKAEALYRMGRRAEARRVWSRLVRIDPLDPGVLRNLAVCDTAGGEPLRALTSWKGYAELLYFFDVVTDDPKGHAAQRAELHRTIGHSYAPAAVYQKSDDWQEKFDPVSVVAFLGSPAGVRNYVEHKLLEYYNVRLQPSSPPVILGIGRSDSKEARERATARWDEFQKLVTDLLPERLAPAVTGVVGRHIGLAIEECGNTTRLAQKRDPTYGDDRKRLLELVIDFCQTKFRFALLLLKAKDLAGQLVTFDGLIELLRLDDAPVDANPELFEAAAAKLGREPDELRKILPDLAAQFVLGAVKYILDVPTDDADETRRRELFARMVQQVVPHPAMKDAVAFIDGPFRSPQLTKKWLTDDSPNTEAPVFRRWHRCFPAMAGVAFRLAQLLLRVSREGGGAVQSLESEAVAALEVGAQQGFFAPSVEICIRQLIALRQGQGKVSEALALAERYRDASTNEVNRKVLARMCLQLKFQAAMEDERFDEALKIGIDLLEDDDRDFKQAEDLIKAFALAAQRLRRDPGRKAVSDAISGWTFRAKARWDRQGGDEMADEDAVTPATIDRVKALRDEAIVQSVVSEHTDAEGAVNYKPLIAGLDALLAQFPGLASAYFQRMLAWDAVSEDTDDVKEKADARRMALADAREVLERSTDANQQKAAQDLINRDEPPIAEETE